MDTSGFLLTKVIHLHPSNFCNLDCQHCYSSSSPLARDEVDIDSIKVLLRELSCNGYEMLSISGGEPLLYNKINELIDYSFDLGLKINLITNGMLLDKIIKLSSKVSMFAISIDGSAEKHDTLRNRLGCFSMLEKNIEQLNKHNIEFGLVSCITGSNIEDVMFLYDFAIKNKARLLQFHPLVATGRGEELNEDNLSSKELNRLYLTTKLLEQASNETNLKIQIDLLPKNYLTKAQTCHFMASNTDSISSYINPIVITEKGDILPYAYGINKNFYLGHITDSFSVIKSRYIKESYKKINKLVSDTFCTFEKSNASVIDWYHLLVSQSNFKK